jgi:hypothetical protein
MKAGLRAVEAAAEPAPEADVGCDEDLDDVQNVVALSKTGWKMDVRSVDRAVQLVTRLEKARTSRQEEEDRALLSPDDDEDDDECEGIMKRARHSKMCSMSDTPLRHETKQGYEVRYVSRAIASEKTTPTESLDLDAASASYSGVDRIVTQCTKRFATLSESRIVVWCRHVPVGE